MAKGAILGQESIIKTVCGVEPDIGGNIQLNSSNIGMQGYIIEDLDVINTDGVSEGIELNSIGNITINTLNNPHPDDNIGVCYTTTSNSGEDTYQTIFYDNGGVCHRKYPDDWIWDTIITNYNSTHEFKTSEKTYIQFGTKTLSLPQENTISLIPKPGYIPTVKNAVLYIKGRNVNEEVIFSVPFNEPNDNAPCYCNINITKKNLISWGIKVKNSINYNIGFLPAEKILYYTLEFIKISIY